MKVLLKAVSAPVVDRMNAPTDYSIGQKIGIIVELLEGIGGDGQPHTDWLSPQEWKSCQMVLAGHEKYPLDGYFRKMFWRLYCDYIDPANARTCENEYIKDSLGVRRKRTKREITRDCNA